MFELIFIGFCIGLGLVLFRYTQKFVVSMWQEYVEPTLQQETPHSDQGKTSGE